MTQANNVAIESSQINSSGVLTVPGGGTGLSTLTTGYIPFGAGTSAFGSSSNLFWDNTNARLGIGTSSPSVPLQTLNSSGEIGVISSSNAGTNYALLRTYNTNNSSNFNDYGTRSDGSAIIFSRAAPTSGNRTFTFNYSPIGDIFSTDTSGNFSVSTGNLFINDSSNVASNPKLYVLAGNTTGKAGAIIRNSSGSAGPAYMGFQGYDWVQGAIWHDRSSGYALSLATNPNTTDLTIGGCVARVNITNAGYVTMPYQPCFQVYRTTSVNSGNIVVFDTVWSNVGSNYNTSNGRFTAPTNGIYELSWQQIGNSVPDVYRMNLYINGSQYSLNGVSGIQSRAVVPSGGQYSFAASLVYVYMGAGDYAQIYFNSDGGNALYGDNSGYCRFSGRLMN